MGRTVPSFRMLLEGIIEDLSVFKRALRGEDKVAFDSLMNKAREHASSCTVAPMIEPMDAVFLSILVEQEKELISLHQSLYSQIVRAFNQVIVIPIPTTIHKNGSHIPLIIMTFLSKMKVFHIFKVCENPS